MPADDSFLILKGNVAGRWKEYIIAGVASSVLGFDASKEPVLLPQSGFVTSAAMDAAIAASVAALVDSSPGTLNTLNELAAALGGDADFAATNAALISDAQAAAVAAQLSADEALGYANQAITYGTSGSFFGRRAADLASAATVSIGLAEAIYVEITGNTTITSFGEGVAQGLIRIVRFTGILTLTHNATSLILPGAANIVTADGDTAVFIAIDAEGNWRCVQYQNAVYEAERTRKGFAASGAVNGSGLTMATAKLLGRATAGTGGIEELTTVQFLANGSAAGVSLGNAAGNGVYFGTNAINFSTSGVLRWTITSSGSLAATGAMYLTAGYISAASGSASVAGLSLGQGAEYNSGLWRNATADHRYAISAADVQQWKAGHTLTLDTAGTMSKITPVAANTADATALTGSTGGDQNTSVTKSVLTAAFIVGKPIRVALDFRYSTSAVSAGTLQIKVKMGGVTLIDYVAQTMTPAVSGKAIFGELVITPITLGASGTVWVRGWLMIDIGTGAPIVSMIPGTAAITLDTTATQTIQPTVAWAGTITTPASNTITLEAGGLQVQ